MSAEPLRRAATILRERVAACEPWEGDDDNGSWAAEYDPDAYEREHGGDSSDIAYIATMHPGVGLALADWLDEVAARAERVEWMGVRVEQVDWSQRPLALARLIVGEQP